MIPAMTANKGRLHALLWNRPPAATTRLWQRKLVVIARLLYLIAHDVSSGLSLRAMSLVYITLLSLVPLLAVSFSILKAFGVHHNIKPMLQEFLSALGPGSEQLTNTIIGFVEGINAGILGSAGIALLFYTVTNLILKVEQTFDYIWHVRGKAGWLQRFSEYFSILLIGPVLIVAALGITATMMSSELVREIIAIEPFGSAYYLAGLLAPYVLVIAAFTLIYMLLPNTKVHFRPALIGATIAGLLWKLTGWLFAMFIATSAQYHAIYSGFTIVITFMFWIYLSWLIFIIGARISYYLQHPAQIALETDYTALSSDMKDRLVLTIMYHIASRHHYGQNAPTADSLSGMTGCPPNIIEAIITLLTGLNYIAETAQTPTTYIPAKDIDTISLSELLVAARSAGNDQVIAGGLHPVEPEIAHLLTQLKQADTSILTRSLGDLVGRNPL